MSIQKLGIIAGSGSLPVIAAEEAAGQNIRLQIYAVSEEEFLSEAGAERFNEQVTPVSLARFGDLLNHLKNDGISHLVLLGKVRKEHLFKDQNFDDKSKQILASLENQNDDTLFFAMLREFEAAGMTVLPQIDFLQGLTLKAGQHAGPELSETDRADIEYGLVYAKKMGELDVGQSVVVKNRAVLAVEAIEGTDQCILRAGRLANGRGGVVCKTAKPSQDARFDVPAVGLTTLKSMSESGCHILAVEAEKTLVITPAEMKVEADKLGITLLAVELNS